MEMDERIFKLRNDAKEAQQNAHSDAAVEQALKQSIYDDTVDIFGHPTVFADRVLLDGQISLRIPDDFITLDEDVVHALYPLGNRPQIVMGNEPFYFMIGFNHTQHRIPETQLKEFPKLAKAMLEKGGPKVTVRKSETIYCNERQIAIMDFTSQTLDGAMYNVMFYTIVDGRLLIGFVNFRYQDRKRMRPLAQEIIESYRRLESKEAEMS